MRQRGYHKAITGSVVVLLWVSVCSLSAGDDLAAQKKADRRFDDLLASSKKDPKKTDWKALRHAFAATSRYNPYNLMWNTEIGKVEDSVESGDAQETEAMLGKLLEREGWMRLDALKLAVTFYDKIGQKEKSRLYGAFVEGISGTILVSGAGFAIEKPIEVLFVDEEYFVLKAMNVKSKKSALVERDGHHFDVLTPEPEQGKPERPLYFNIDLPYKALGKSVEKLIDDGDLPVPDLNK